MGKKVTFHVKDPDVHSEIRGEKKRQDFCDTYTEFGEYFMIEIDLDTKLGRLLPRSEWNR